MNREEELFKKRLKDLASAADRRGIVVFTDFMNLNELNIFHSCTREFGYVSYQLFGGYEHAERQIAAFLPDALSYSYDFPIISLKIRPLQKKFAEDLSHRDYLGAVLNLGIDRACLGDILVEEDAAYLFCLERMADFIRDNLIRIRHTSVYVEQVEAENFHYEPKYKEVSGTVASVRLDKLLALAFNASRSSLTGLIEGGKVFVNGKLVTSNGYEPKEGDLISVRGMGRFRFRETGGQSKKGREYVILWRYI